MSKFKMMIVGIGLVGLLGACGDSTAGVDENVDSVSGTNEVSGEVEEVNGDDVSVKSALSSYPIGVQNGSVTKEYYDANYKFNGEYIKFRQNGFNINNQPEKSEESRKQAILDFLVYINSINKSPSTSAEKELDEYFTSMIYHAENEATYALEYLNRKEDVYKNMYLDSRKSFLTSLEIYGEIADKFEVSD